MTPTPHLQAAAMRARAAEAGYAVCGVGSRHIVSDAILALPLEADHATLLAEARKLPEVAALIAAANAVDDEYVSVMHGPAISAMEPLRDALSALETP